MTLEDSSMYDPVHHLPGFETDDDTYIRAAARIAVLRRGSRIMSTQSPVLAANPITNRAGPKGRRR